MFILIIINTDLEDTNDQCSPSKCDIDDVADDIVDQECSLDTENILSSNSRVK